MPFYSVLQSDQRFPSRPLGLTISTFCSIRLPLLRQENKIKCWKLNTLGEDLLPLMLCVSFISYPLLCLLDCLSFCPNLSASLALFLSPLSAVLSVYLPLFLPFPSLTCFCLCPVFHFSVWPALTILLQVSL